jgi:hypothetical protein
MLVTIDRAGANVVLDCSISEKHSGDVELSKHPIESGSDATNHSREMPEKLTLEGLLTNTHVNKATQQARSPGWESGDDGYAQQVFARLLALKSERRAVVVETAHRVYRSVMMTKLDVPRDGKMQDAIHFTASFEEVKFATLKTAILRNPVGPKAGLKAEHGKKPADKTERYDGLVKTLLNAADITKSGSGIDGIPLP